MSQSAARRSGRSPSAIPRVIRMPKSTVSSISSRRVRTSSSIRRTPIRYSSSDAGVAKPGACVKRMRRAADADILPARPIGDVVRTFKTGARVVGDFVPRVTRLREKPRGMPLHGKRLVLAHGRGPGCDGRSFFEDEAVRGYVLRRKRDRAFERPLPVADRLSRQRVHEVEADILKPRLARHGKRPLRLLRRMDAADRPQEPHRQTPGRPSRAD